MSIKDRNEPWQSGMAKNITFIVTKDCQLACKYCHLVGKNVKERMSWEVAKTFIYAKATIPMSNQVQAAPPGHELPLVGTIALGRVRWH